MTFTLRNPDGTPWGGENHVSKEMRAKADEMGGYITDDTTGDTVYPTED